MQTMKAIQKGSDVMFAIKSGWASLVFLVLTILTYLEPTT